MPARKSNDVAGALAPYRAKRDFAVTTEPRGDDTAAASAGAATFVVQKHRASRLHYDFRLELDGVLLSWALPKGLCHDPADMRIAIHVEDHPLEYGSFEGTIPKGQYGAGSIIVWDRGTWEPAADARQGLRDGKLVFTLHGQKLAGQWELVRITKPGDKQDSWMLFKKRDRHARPLAEYDVLAALPDSVIARPLKANLQAGGKVGPLPASLQPQLASLAAAAPGSDQWLWEIKFDGYRLLARIEGEDVKLVTRGGHDWAAKMPDLVRALRALQLQSAWLDGEIVVLGADGVPDFGALQNALASKRSPGIEYFLFDAPYLEGRDLRQAPLLARREALERLLHERPQQRLRFSAAFDAGARQILESTRRMGLEGVVAKRKDAPYVCGRSETWLKLKNRQRQEFVIAGYRDRSSGEPQVGSLLLAVHEDDGALRYVGKVGTGWDTKTAEGLKARLARMEVADSPFGAQRLNERGAGEGALHWVQAKLVAEVEFADWTADQQLRHATFVALRADKPARAVRRETAVMPSGPVLAPGGGATVEGIAVSNPDRVIDAASGVTKLELVRYYASVAEWMLPHLQGRPCSLVRGPQGVGGELFYQKHLNEQQIAEVRELPVTVWPDHAPLLEVATAKALAAAAQVNVIEFHTWNARARKPQAPDRVVFDLDPGDGVRWEHVQEAALLVRGMLAELGLQSWLKTSGGKGLHVVAPLATGDSWDTVFTFSQAVVQHLARVIPQRFVDRMGAANRVGRIFVDYLRNKHGATTAAAFSARSRPGLGVSMPIAWDELPALQRSDQWNVRTARDHLSFQQSDPWADYWSCKQNLKAGRKALGLKAAGR